MLSHENGGGWAARGRASRARLAWWTLACSITLAGGALAAEALPRSAGQHSSAQIIDAGPAEHEAPGTRLAGIEVRLDPGFITYWRTPGDAGVPPIFDFGRSENVKEARIEYPAPRRFDEAGSEAFGYDTGVIFPLLVVPRDPALPIKLDLAFDYAVCGNICLPAKAHLELLLEGPATADAGRVRDALAEVPQQRQVGDTGPVRVDRVSPMQGGALSVDATVPEGLGTLFAEAPEGWFFKASSRAPRTGGHLGFTLTLIEKPSSGAPPAEPMRLTLVTPAGSIEVPVRLDAKTATP